MSVEKALRETKIRELKSPPPVCVEKSTSLAEAIRSMRARRAGCVLVCEQGRVAGILTERDFLNKIAGEQALLDSAVESFMTANPKTIRSDDHLSDAVLMMDGGDYRHLPVTGESGRLEGLITIHHIIEFLAEMFAEEVLNLPPRPNQLMDSREGE